MFLDITPCIDKGETLPMMLVKDNVKGNLDTGDYRRNNACNDPWLTVLQMIEDGKPYISAVVMQAT